MAIIMTLRIVNGTVLKSSSLWQSKEFGHNLFIFKILLTAISTFLVDRYWNFKIVLTE